MAQAGRLIRILEFKELEVTTPECRKWAISLVNYGYGWEWRAETETERVIIFGSDHYPNNVPPLTKWGARHQAKRQIRKRFPKPPKPKHPFKTKSREYEVCL